jgi:hypothetical protein
MELSDTMRRILASCDDADRALLIPFGAHMRAQEAAGRTFTHREVIQEFYRFYRPKGATEAQLAGAVEAAIAGGSELRRSKMG